MDANEREEKLYELRKLRTRIKNNKDDRNKIYVENITKAFMIWSPTIVAALTAISFFKTEKNSPFTLDYVEKSAITTISYSSDIGVMEKTKEYATSHKSVDEDVMVYYGPWEQQEDGTYVTTTTEYILNDLTVEQAERLLSREDLSFDDVSVLSVKKTNDSTYKKNDVTENDLEMEPHFEIKIYDRDINDTVITKETVEENWGAVGMLVGFGVISALGEIVAYAIAKLTKALPYEKTYGISEKIENYKEQEKKLVKELKK